MLVPVKSLLSTQAIEYVNIDFYNDYIKHDHGKLKLLIFNKIIITFFTKISKEILRGFNFGTPLGSIFVMKILNNPNVKYISHAGTRKARKETGDNSIVIYRDEPYFFKMRFEPNIAISGLKNYSFKASWKNNRDTQKNFDILTLHVV